MRGIRIQYLQIDEIWNFVAKKQRWVLPEDPEEYGDVYTFVALDQDSKLVPSFLVGKRTGPNTRRFMDDLAGRIEGRVQITTDGWFPYPGAVRNSFNGRAAYGQIIKNYAGGSFDVVSRRYSPPRLASIRRVGMWGLPNARYLSTSHVERQNLTMRMQMRRFTRLTNAFSKKLANLEAAVALHFAHYNFCRRHSAHDLTPAVMAGVASERWPVSTLLPV